MMRENKLRRILREGKTSVATRLWSTWPLYTESLGATGNFDYMEFVAEYAPFTQADLENMARAAERRNLPLETAEVLPGGEMPEPSPILSAVQALPAKYSAVIHLYYYEGYSIKEISKLLQIPLPTVGTRLSRGRERLRQLLKEDVE